MQIFIRCCKSHVAPFYVICFSVVSDQFWMVSQSLYCNTIQMVLLILKIYWPSYSLLLGAANWQHHLLGAGDSVALTYWCYQKLSVSYSCPSPCPFLYLCTCPYPCLCHGGVRAQVHVHALANVNVSACDHVHACTF